MEFKVHTAHPEPNPSFGGSSSYSIGSSSGVLVVSSDDGRKISYSPSGWLQVEEFPPEYRPRDTFR